MTVSPLGNCTSTLSSASFLFTISPRFIHSTFAGLIGREYFGENSGKSNGLGAISKSSSSSASIHSTTPVLTKSLNESSPALKPSSVRFVSTKLPSSSTSKGLKILPLSVFMNTSLFSESCLILTSGLILPERRRRLN